MQLLLALHHMTCASKAAVSRLAAPAAVFGWCMNTEWRWPAGPQNPPARKAPMASSNIPTVRTREDMLAGANSGLCICSAEGRAPAWLDPNWHRFLHCNTAVAICMLVHWLSVRKRPWDGALAVQMCVHAPTCATVPCAYLPSSSSFWGVQPPAARESHLRHCKPGRTLSFTYRRMGESPNRPCKLAHSASARALSRGRGPCRLMQL